MQASVNFTLIALYIDWLFGTPLPQDVAHTLNGVFVNHVQLHTICNDVAKIHKTIHSNLLIELDIWQHGPQSPSGPQSRIAKVLRCSVLYGRPYSVITRRP
jgi:hypothetical protein